MAWVAIGVAGVSLISKVVVGGIEAKKAKQAEQNAAKLNQPYQPSQYAQDNLATAKQLFNGPMFGSQQLERNIQGNEANATAANARGATSGSQFLAAQAANQGATNQADQNLQLQESQNKYALLNNLNLANSGMVNEGDKQFMQQNQQYRDQANQAFALRQSSLANYFGAMNDATSLTSLGVSYMNNKKQNSDNNLLG